MHDDFLSIAPGREERHGPFSAPPSLHRNADLHHLAGALEAEQVGGSRWRWIEPLALQQVRAVDSRIHHSDANVVRPEQRCLNLAGSEHVLITKSIEHDGTHGLPYSAARGAWLSQTAG
jgi:hypothetical protein